MTSLYDCVLNQHNFWLVLLAGGICALGSISTFEMGKQVFRCRTAREKLPWAAAGIVSTSSAIWATHFVAMLAFEPGMPAGFDIWTTAASFFVALMLVASAAYVVSISLGWLGRTLGGLLVGVAIAAMHYTGMAGYRVQGLLTWDLAGVAVSVLVGVGFASLAVNLGLARRPRLRLLAPFALTLAVCGAHFIGMTSATLTFDPRIDLPPEAMDGAILTILTTNVILLILGISMTSLRLWVVSRRRHEQESQRLRDLADIAVEGLMICDGSNVFGINRSLERIVGSDRNSLVGRPVADLLPRVSISDIPFDCELDTFLRAFDGVEIPVRVIAQSINIGARSRTVIAVRDQRERLTAEAAMHRLAHHDSLTGLANRLQFNETLKDWLPKSDGFALLSVDLDRFKLVNDNLGHGTGDALLRKVANRLRRVVREGDLVARLGGDEFAILKSGTQDLATVQKTAERLIDVLGRPYLIGGHVVDIGASIGIALAPDDGETPEEIVRSADLALYGAKENGRGRYRMFEDGMNSRMQERRSLEIDLRRAIARQEFELFYQPQVDARTGQFDGAEALIRWHHPERGLVAPAEFIPLAEETGLIAPLSEWVLRTACAEARHWPSHLVVAVNLSPVQFRDARLGAAIRNVLKETGLPGHRLEVEVTEGALLQDEHRTLAILQDLRAAGVRISMDDFGTGYSSLSYLRRFPFDKIKIDQSFVKQTPADKDSAAIVRAIVTLGASLGLKTTAEGIETAEQSSFVAAAGCDQLQGYLFSRPVPAVEIAAIFACPPVLAAVA